MREETAAPQWQQLYFLSTREKTLEFVRRVESANFTALVVTVDAAVGGLRERAARVDFRFPSDVVWANQAISPSDWKASAGLVNSRATWEDVAWLCEATALPVLVKGVMCAGDAIKAVQCGAKGVIVSNHGGRQLDQGPSTAAALPGIVCGLREARLQCDVLVDGGIRRGSDVVKALALGADAVLIGRPIVWGLAVDGGDGVADVLRLLKREVMVTMQLCGKVTVAEIDGSAMAAGHGIRTHARG